MTRIRPTSVLSPERNIGAAWRTDRRRKNNFDLLRLLAAFAVLFSHAGVVSTGLADSDPLASLTGGRAGLGDLGVYFFFAISGFLVTGSYLNSRSVTDYLIRRTLRILPGLMVVTLAAVVVLGPIATILPLTAYMSSYKIAYYLANMIFAVRPSFVLPGVFEHNPFPANVNASIWTIRYECFCYALVLGLGYAGALLSGGRTVLLLCIITVVGALWVTSGIYGHAFFSGLATYFLAFAAGTLLFVCREKVPLSPILLLASGIAMAVGIWLGVASWVLPVTAAYASVCLGLTQPVALTRALKGNDLSYGVYLYAFPVQQFVAMKLGHHSPWLNVVLSVPPVLLVAVLSWRFVEKPCLRLKHNYVGRGSTPAVEPQLITPDRPEASDM